MLPFDEDDFDQFSEKDQDQLRDIFGDMDTAHAIYDFLADNWHPNEGGFDSQQIFDMIYEIDNFQQWEDEDGVMHYSFDYWWESEDGEYQGHGSYSG